MISMARTFGAPETVPAGTQARNQQMTQAFSDAYNKTQGQSGVLQSLANQQNARQAAKQENVSKGGQGFDQSVTGIFGGLLGAG